MLNNFINNIIEGDCLKILNEIPDNSIDVCFADPPFNLGKKYNGYLDNKAFEEYIRWCDTWLFEMVRIAKPTGSIFVHNIPKWLTFYAQELNKIAYFRHWIAWDAPSAPMGNYLQPSHYGILYYEKIAKKSKHFEIRHPHKRCRKCGFLLKDYGGKKAQIHPFGPLISDVWTDIHRIRHNKYRDEHPCQLPIHLLERLILMSTDEGDVVLDPFVGTGTTVIAAKRLGRKYIGIELDRNYVTITNNKLQKEVSNSKFGGSWVSFFGNNIVTIRDHDWASISSCFDIPDSIQIVDRFKISAKENEYCQCQESLFKELLKSQ